MLVVAWITLALRNTLGFLSPVAQSGIGWRLQFCCMRFSISQLTLQDRSVAGAFEGLDNVYLEF